MTSDEPDIKGKRVVFDPAVDARTTGSLRDWSENRRNWRSLFSDWKADFEAAEPRVRGQTEQEIGLLDDLYDGSTESYLSGLRNREGQVMREAGDRALQFAGGRANRAALGRNSGIGDSSADRALSYNLAKDVEMDIAKTGVARERGDFDYLQRLKLGNVGKRSALVEGLVNRKLRIQDLSNAQLMASIQELAAITNIRNAVAQPVFWQDRDNFVDKLSYTLDTVVDTAGNLLSAYGGGGYTNSAGSGGGAPIGSYVDSRQPISSGMSYAQAPTPAPSQPGSTAGMSYDQKGPYDAPSWRDTSGWGVGY